MAGWHHRLDGREFEWTLGVGDGQGGLACCDSWGRKELDTTEPLNWTELNWRFTWLHTLGCLALRWVTIPLWLSWVIKSFLYSSSVYSCHCFLISSASVRSVTFSVLYHAHPYVKCSLDISKFLKRSLVFPILLFSFFFFFCSVHLRRPHFSLLFSGPLYLSLSSLSFPSLLSSAISKPPQTIILPFCISFSLGWFWSLPSVQC